MDIDFFEPVAMRDVNLLTVLANVNGRRVTVEMPLDEAEHLYEDWENFAVPKIEREVRRWGWYRLPARIVLDAHDFASPE